MKARFNEITFHNNKTKIRGKKTVTLPFTRVSARALLLRRSDGAIFGVRHRPGTGMALPGGGLDDGETPTQAAIRELQEENISLINPDENWEERFGVDYYGGYRELNFWFLIAVDDVKTAPSKEILETDWVPQSENPWYPGMHPLLLQLIGKHLPHYLNK